MATARLLVEKGKDAEMQPQPAIIRIQEVFVEYGQPGKPPKCILNGASLTVNGGIVQIAGTIVNNGIFDAGNGSIDMSGSSAQIIPAAIFAGNTIKNLTLDNGAGVTLNGTLNLTGILKASNGSFNAGGYLTLLSTAAGTALIDGNEIGRAHV